MEQDLYLHGLIKAVPVETPAWTRPTDWITVPDLLPEDDKIYLLVKIFENTTENPYAFTCTGNYTVDWGDGSAPENVASGVKAEHQYDYNDISVGTLTSEGFRQALITITPNGGVLLTANVAQVATGYNNRWREIPIIEIKFNCPSMTFMAMCEYHPSTDGSLYSLQRVVIGENNISDMTGLLAYNYAYKEIIFTGDLTHVTSVYRMFAYTNNGPLNLEFSPTAFVNCTNFSDMFAFSGISEAPVMDTSSGTNFSGMFYYCYGLISTPLYDISSGTNFSNMFKECWTLADTGGAFNTSNGTNFIDMFYNCYALTNIPITSTTSGTAFGGTFAYCANVDVVPALNFANNAGGTINAAFWNMKNLRNILATGIKDSVYVNQCMLDRDAIVVLFNNLATVVGKTITVSDNPGAADLTGADLLIATSKGWTVVT